MMTLLWTGSMELHSTSDDKIRPNEEVKFIHIGSLLGSQELGSYLRSQAKIKRKILSDLRGKQGQR